MNEKNNKCYWCKQNTLSYVVKKSILSCSKCGLVIEMNGKQNVNLREVFGENGSLWYSYTKYLLLSRHSLGKEIGMNIFSIETLKEWKYKDLKFIQNPKEESLKDFIGYFMNRESRFVEFTSVHEPTDGNVKNGFHLIDAKWEKIKGKEVCNYDYDLVFDFFIDPFLKKMQSGVFSGTNTTGQDKDLKTSLILNAKKYLYFNYKPHGDFLRDWDLEFFNTGFNDVYVSKLLCDPFSNAVVCEIWSLRNVIDQEESTYIKVFSKSEIDKIACDVGFKTFFDFVNEK